MDITAIYEKGSVVLVLLPFLLVLPPAGRAVAASRWSAISWVVGISVGVAGTLFISDHRVAILSWAPLYQLAVYAAALQLFRHSLHRFPRFAVWDLFTDGLFWDQLFLIGVLLVSILPCIHFARPDGAVAPRRGINPFIKIPHTFEAPANSSRIVLDGVEVGAVNWAEEGLKLLARVVGPRGNDSRYSDRIRHTR